MPERLLPRYPIYVPSKGRHDACYTARFLIQDGVPFRLVVEPGERDRYAAAFGPERVLTLPWDNPGSVIPARNWIKEHATAAGYERHWQLDDNIRRIRRLYRGKRIPCAAGVALRVVVDFADRYGNVALAGLNYEFFAIGEELPPFYLNSRVYSCTLVLNRLPHRWRGRYNEDTDLCLQVLADGWCTVLVNAFLTQKARTMTIKGGNTAALYQGDGRLKMARSLERLWPGVVKTSRRFQRPQHVVYDAWRRFDTPLRLKPGVDLAQLPPVDDYGLRLAQVAEIKSESLRRWYAAQVDQAG